MPFNIGLFLLNGPGKTQYFDKGQMFIGSLGGLPNIKGRGCSSYLLGVKIKCLVSFRVSKYMNINFSNNNSPQSIKL